jgi:hypothetical protein
VDDALFAPNSIQSRAGETAIDQLPGGTALPMHP